MKNEALFATREQAASVLAKRLARYQDSPDHVVLSLPGGGAEVGHAIAASLRLPFDVLVVSPIEGPPACDRPIGAMTGGGVRMLDFNLIDRLHLDEDDVRAAIRRCAGQVNRREWFLRAGRPAVNVADHSVILSDDGSSRCEMLRHAVRLLHRCHVERVVLATAAACRRVACDLKLEVDEMICLTQPSETRPPESVFRNSPHTSYARVRDLLHAG